MADIPLPKMIDIPLPKCFLANTFNGFVQGEICIQPNYLSRYKSNLISFL